MKINEMEVNSMKNSKADLHVHSKYSTRPSYWILQKIGCSESYTEPLKLYSIAMDRGMNFVTITDHDSVEGCLEIAHLRDTFISEEITTYFPQDGCKLHVLAYGITERQHADISSLRKNIFELVEYLNQERIVYAAAHPMYSINNLLAIKHFEQQIILFKNFELNGSQDACQNNILSCILKNLTPDAIELLANKHNLKPYGDRPWEKNLIGGSDDHSSLNIASTYTEVEGVSSAEEFLKGIGQNNTCVKGQPSDPRAMAHSLYSIAYQFYKNKFHIGHKVNKDIVLRFVDNTLSLSNNKEYGLVERLISFISYQRPKYFFNSAPKRLQDLFRESAREVIREDPRMYKLVKKSDSFVSNEIESLAMTNVWFGFVDKVSEKMLKKFADSILKSLSNANLLDIFQTIGSVGSLYISLALYFVGYTHFRKDHQFCSQCRDHFFKEKGDLPEEQPENQIKVAHFTDTFNDVNGVAKTLQMHLKIAKQNNKALTMIVCDSKSEASGVVNFSPVGAFELPEYPEMKLYYPPLLKMLDYCFKQKFTHIHSATPGPVGLAALAIARILKLPFYGTYHTALPQYVSQLTGDPSMEEIMWKYIIWYYNQMEVVFTPSEATAEELSKAGIPEEKIHFYPRGIDIESFSPSNRNGFFRSKFMISEDDLKLLYVGRVSKEKSLQLLVEVFIRLTKIRAGIHLIIVGDGPYLSEMKKVLKNLPVTFTGFLHGDDLTQAYASSDIFIFPSTTDTFGNVVLEAQASGLPVIVTDSGGPKENLINGETGFIVPSGDINGFANAVLKLTNNTALLQKMSQNARDYTKNRSFESAFLKLWDMHRSLTPNGHNGKGNSISYGYSLKV